MTRTIISVGLLCLVGLAIVKAETRQTPPLNQSNANSGSLGSHCHDQLDPPGSHQQILAPKYRQRQARSPGSFSEANAKSGTFGSGVFNLPGAGIRPGFGPSPWQRERELARIERERELARIEREREFARRREGGRFGSSSVPLRQIGGLSYSESKSVSVGVGGVSVSKAQSVAVSGK